MLKALLNYNPFTEKNASISLNKGLPANGG